MARRLRFLLLIALVVAQLAVYRYYWQYRFDVDLFYLIVFYAAIKMGFLESLTTAVLIGLVTDFLSGGVLGVFSFSRVVTVYLLNSTSRYIDLRKNLFVFLLIFISLLVANGVASLFFHFIFKYRVVFQLLVLQPLLTALIGSLIVASAKTKALLHVY